MIGLLLAVAVLILQLYLGVIPEEFSLRAVASVALPYTALFALLSVWVAASSIVDLDAEQGKKIVELTPSPLSAPQRQRLAEVSEIFGGCSRDALNILNRVASGPHPVYAARKAAGAEEFNACTEGAFNRGILRVETNNRRGEFYVLGDDKWKETVEHFLSERLD